MNLDIKLITEEMKKFQDRSRMEADVIVGGIINSGALDYVDLGCWAGTLAKDVLSSIPVKGYLVDGCIDLLNIADYLCGACRLNYKVFEAVITPVRWNGYEALQVPKHSTGSGSLLHKEKYDDTSLYYYKDGVVTNIIKLQEQLEIHFKNAFLKIDLEGIDGQIVNNLMDASIYPKGLHFEIKNENEFNNLRPKLNRYTLPDKLPDGHEFWTISLVRDKHFWIVIGMNPDKVYYME